MFLKSLLVLATSSLIAASAPLTYEGTEGPGKGKHIVFIANDHEYRSEETCPAIAKILAKHHGFKCTVLFGVDENGHIKAGGAPIPNIEVLKDADLLFFYTRFMQLPDDQADILVDYFERGGPVIGLRTSTHCFNKQQGKWAKLNFNYKGEDYLGGLGEQIFGNSWHPERGQGHYGQNHKKGSRISPLTEGAHPILTGVKPLHAYSGAYLSRLPAEAAPLLQVEVLNTFGPGDELQEGKGAVSAGWARDHYVAPSGGKKEARVVYASFGASEDILDDNSRRFLINSSLWTLGLEESIKPDLNVNFVGGFNPSPYTTGSFYRMNVKPSDLAGWDSSVMPIDSKLKGLDDPSPKMKGRIYSVLSQRPEMVKQISKAHPDFKLEDLKPAKKK